MSDQSKRFELPSGGVVVITTAQFQDAWALTKAALKSLKGGAGLSQGELNRDFASIGSAALSVPGLLDRLISFATSDEVEAAMFKCAARALYIPNDSVPSMPGIPVNRALFDDPQYGNAAREDYAMIMARILEVNAKPFLAATLSKLSGPKRAEETPTSAPSTETA